jgi:hypothetical protein
MRRVPFANMIYIADGPSDVPAWSVVRGNGGQTFGVYQRGSRGQFEQISALLRDGRIHAFGEADYRPDSTAWLWLTNEVRRIAERIAEERAAALRRAVRPPARHITDHPPAVHGGTDAPAEAGAERAAAAGRADQIRDAVRRQLESEAGDEEGAPRRAPTSFPSS